MDETYTRSEEFDCKECGKEFNNDVLLANHHKHHCPEEPSSTINRLPQMVADHLAEGPDSIDISLVSTVIAACAAKSPEVKESLIDQALAMVMNHTTKSEVADDSQVDPDGEWPAY